MGCFSDLHLFREIVFWNPSSICSKKCDVIFNRQTEYRDIKFNTSCLKYFSIVSLAYTWSVGSLPGTIGVIDVAEITKSLNHNNSSSILQLFKTKSRD